MTRLIRVSSISIWAIVIFRIRSAYGQDCDRFNTSRIPEADPSSILEVDYFSCADGEFLTSVDVWHFLIVGEVRWTCSDGDSSYYPEELASYLGYSRATFDVGITAVETRYDALFYDGSSDTLVFFGDCYIGGYNFSSSASTSDGGNFVLSGPFGTGGTNYTIETWTSSCPDNSYATGVTWWTSANYNFVNGVKLECAEVTSTCYPPALENQDDDLISTDEDDETGETGSTESNDASSGTGLGIIIAAAIGAAVAVVFVAVAVGICFFRFRRQKPARGQEIEGSRTTGQSNARALPLPAVAAAQIPMPITTAHPPAYEDPPPAYESPHAAPYGPPPQYAPPSYARTVD